MTQCAAEEEEEEEVVGPFFSSPPPVYPLIHYHIILTVSQSVSGRYRRVCALVGLMACITHTHTHTQRREEEEEEDEEL